MKTNFADLERFFKPRYCLSGVTLHVCHSLMFGKDTSAKVCELMGERSYVKMISSLSCQSENDLFAFQELLSGAALKEAGAKAFEGTGKDNIYWLEDQKLLLVYDGSVDYLFTFTEPK